MDIVIDLSKILDIINQPMHILLWQIFYNVGWIPVAVVLLWGFKEIWLMYIQGQWGSTQESMFLAIDVPRGNEQSPKAVENMFAYLAGAHGTFNKIEEYWEGKYQLSFSFEIVGIEGYTQFVIKTPTKSRDLVESAIYAQYPDAEITEVDDYTKGMPTRFPNDEYDIWGAEFIQKENSAYPIKTYEEFEHQMGDPKVTYRDPMASLMDLTSSLKKGEQIWYQMILVPIGFEWPEIGEKEISKILKEKVKSKRNIADFIIDSFLGLLGVFSEMIYGMWGDIEDKKDSKEEDESLKMMNLKPKEKKQIEAIQQKVSKIGFEFKIRYIYIAKKDVMNKPKAVNGFVGFMKQFTSMDLNNLKPDMNRTATSASYFFKEKRLNYKKTSIINGYMGRDGTVGRAKGVLNIEELATIWHFPVESAVKAPLIQKASRRKAEPPMSLPTGVETVSEELKGPMFDEEVSEKKVVPATDSAKPGFFDEEQAEDKGEKTKVRPEVNNDPPIRKKEEKTEVDQKEKGSPPDNLPFI